MEVETVMHHSDIQPQKRIKRRKKISSQWKCHRVLPPVISLRAFLTHYMTGWKIVLYRFAVKRETRCREKASRCFFWGASMKRLRCVRALGERSLKWQGLIKSIFVVRNNTSVRGEITEGASISSKNNYTPNTSSRSTPRHRTPSNRPQPWGFEWQLRWGECAMHVPRRDERWQPVKRSQRKDRGTKQTFVAQSWHHLLQVSFSPTEFVNHLGRSSHFESILKHEHPSWMQVKSWCTNIWTGDLHS